ncbi:MAG: tetratricopeptide repeat protein, partial [Cyanobacteria bacterium P01_G01_bin.19]
GDALYQQEKLDEALAEYQEAARLSSNNPEVLAGMGQVYLAQSSYFKAVVTFRKLTEIEPNNPRGYHNLGIALKARGRNSEAISNLDRALALYESEGNEEEAENVAVLIDEIDNDD